MPTHKTLKVRLARLEVETPADAVGALPIVVPEDELQSPRAEALRADGYQVLTFEQCVEAML